LRYAYQFHQYLIRHESKLESSYRKITTWSAAFGQGIANLMEKVAFLSSNSADSANSRRCRLGDFFLELDGHGACDLSENSSVDEAGKW
jgi:hypothetical protein